MIVSVVTTYYILTTVWCSSGTTYSIVVVYNVSFLAKYNVKYSGTFS